MNIDIVNSVILIAEDDKIDLKIAVNVFKNTGYKLMVAEDGQTAFDLVVQEMPDIILADVIMPEMNGLEICRLLKKNKRTADIPFIFLTALDSAYDRVRGFEAGGVDYIIKPFDANEVLARVRTHLTLYKRLRSCPVPI